MKRIVALVCLGLLAGASTPAGAQSKGMALLKKYEKRYTNFGGQLLEFKLWVGRPGQMKLKARLTARNRPNGQRLSLMTYPGDVKGMHFLVQSSSEMYIYLPAFKRVRRIAGHIRNRGFLGSGFTYEDLGIHCWSNSYTVKLVKTTARYYWLDLRAIKGKGALYPRVRMSIRRDIGYAESFRYYNTHGKNHKTQQFLKYKCRADKSHCNPMLIRIIEHTRGHRRSDLIVTRLKYRKRFSDRMFSLRYLIRSAD